MAMRDIPMKDRITAMRSPEVIEAGAAAYAAAYAAAKAQGASDDEADVAGKNASLAARKQMVLQRVK